MTPLFGAATGQQRHSEFGFPQTVAGKRYAHVRHNSEALAAPLALDDYNLQAMPDVSPAKWHLAHTTWFFETFLLKPYLPGYEEFCPQFAVLFNSYYNEIGQQFPRAKRSLLSRPTTDEVFRYRQYVDKAMSTLLAIDDGAVRTEIDARVILGCNHEEQHQELFLTDIKYNFAINPLKPAYRDDLRPLQTATSAPISWLNQPGGDHAIGHAGDGFLFDNESPRHRVLLTPHSIASRLVTNGEYLEFIRDNGYRRAELWLADGWNAVRTHDWNAPLYWEQRDGQWWTFTLGGMRPVNEHEPVCHVSLYEADAFARWSGARLPTESEWEVFAEHHPIQGNLRDADHLHPKPASDATSSAQVFGDVWEWTQSAYAPYPGYRAAPGALGEYNGKFMMNQIVLRGGSCVTPAEHIRASYRNFFYPKDRWQFSGLRLVRDI